MVDPELSEHFETSLTQVRTVPVETRVVPLSQLRVAPPRREETNSIEASLRLDAVASAGQGSMQWHCLGDVSGVVWLSSTDTPLGAAAGFM